MRVDVDTRYRGRYHTSVIRRSEDWEDGRTPHTGNQGYRATAHRIRFAIPSDLAWMERAACLDSPLDFTAEREHWGRRSQAEEAQLDEYRAVCRFCPVQNECLDQAVETYLDLGTTPLIQAGFTRVEIAQMVDGRDRRRPGRRGRNRT